MTGVLANLELSSCGPQSRRRGCRSTTRHGMTGWRSPYMARPVFLSPLCRNRDRSMTAGEDARGWVLASNNRCDAGYRGGPKDTQARQKLPWRGMAAEPRRTPQPPSRTTPQWGAGRGGETEKENPPSPLSPSPISPISPHDSLASALAEGARELLKLGRLLHLVVRHPPSEW